MIDRFATLIPDELRNESGSVFCSGREAFSGTPLPLVYILGANPGGDPDKQSNETVQSQSDFVRKEAPERWSTYCDDSWGERLEKGQAPLQLRVQHLLSQLNLDPRLVPASNLVFSRSRQLKDLDFAKLAELCWPFHAAVIDILRPNGIICFGAKTSEQVRRLIVKSGREDQFECVDQFQESYDNRNWTSRVWKSPTGLLVFELTHPSWADWTNPSADPSPMVKKALRM